MGAPQIIDPGVGRADAPIGSEEWAKRVRLRMQGIVNAVDAKPGELSRYVDAVQSHEAWRVLTNEHGKPFSTWEAFCEYRQPWGLGAPVAKVAAYVAIINGDWKAAPPVTGSLSVTSPGSAESTRNDVTANLTDLASLLGFNRRNAGPCANCNDARITSRGVPYRQHKRGRFAGWCWACSGDVLKAETRRPKVTRPCATCGKSFTGTRSDALHCSRACRQRAYRERQTSLSLGVTS